MMILCTPKNFNKKNKESIICDNEAISYSSFKTCVDSKMTYVDDKDLSHSKSHFYHVNIKMKQKNNHEYEMSQSQVRLAIRKDDLTVKILECTNGFEYQDNLINEEVDGMLGGHNGDVFLSQSEVSILVRADFVLNETSCFAEICHYIGGYVKK